MIFTLTPSASNRSAAGRARVGSRHFDQHIWPVYRCPEATSLDECALGVVRQPRGHLDRDDAVQTRSLIVQRSEEAARLTNVQDRQRLEDFPGGLALCRELRQLLVVGVARGDGLLENARIGGHAAQAVLLDEASQLPAAHQIAADEVQPDALAFGHKRHEGVGPGIVCGDRIVCIHRVRC